MTHAFSDVLLVGGRPNQWVKYVNNDGNAAHVYVSTAVTTFQTATTGAGVYTFNPSPIGGIYTSYLIDGSLSASAPAAADIRWAATGITSHVVAYTAGDDAALDSVTASTGPNTNKLQGDTTLDTPAGVVNGDVYDYGGAVFHAGQWGVKFDGSDQTAALTKFINAANATNGRYRLPAGTAVVSSTLPTLTNYESSIEGPGRESCSMKYTGSGDCMRVQMNPWPGNPAGAGLPWNVGPKLLGFTLDGSGAAAGAVGLHWGDVVGGETDIGIQHFNGVGSIGLLLDNETHWTERNRLKISLSDNTVAVAFTIGGTGTTSFAYNEFDFQMAIQTGQTGFQSIGTAVLYNARVFAMANMATNGTFIDMSAGTAAWINGLVHLRVEQSGTGGVFANIAAGAQWRNFGVCVTAAMTVTGTLGGVYFSDGDGLDIAQNVKFLAASGLIIGGSSNIVFKNNANSAVNLQIDDGGGVTARGSFVAGNSSANQPRLNGAAALSPVQVVAQGSDTDIGIQLAPKGAGAVSIASGGLTIAAGGETITLGDLTLTAGNLIFAAAAARVIPGVTQISFRTNANNADNIVIADAGSLTVRGALVAASGSANQPRLNGAAGGSAPALVSQGSDTDIDVRISPKGAGVLDLNYAAVALGGGAAPTVGTIGGSGPATAAQHGWVKLKAAGTAMYVPEWR